MNITNIGEPTTKIAPVSKEASKTSSDVEAPEGESFESSLNRVESSSEKKTDDTPQKDEVSASKSKEAKESKDAAQDPKDCEDSEDAEEDTDYSMAQGLIAAAAILSPAPQINAETADSDEEDGTVTGAESASTALLSSTQVSSDLSKAQTQKTRAIELTPTQVISEVSYQDIAEGKTETQKDAAPTASLKEAAEDSQSPAQKSQVSGNKQAPTAKTTPKPTTVIVSQETQTLPKVEKESSARKPLLEAPVSFSTLTNLNKTEASLREISSLTLKSESLSDIRSVTTQVREVLSPMLREKKNEISIRLEPEEWGRVDVKVKFQSDEIHVQFTTQHTFVKDALERGVSQLRQSLESDGLLLGQVNVGVGGEAGTHREFEDRDFEKSLRPGEDVLAKAKPAAVAARVKSSLVDMTA